MEVKGIFSSIKSTINGMSSQMARIGAISQNIANAEKLPDEDGNVYKRKVVKQFGYNSSGNNFDQQLSIKMKKTKVAILVGVMNFQVLHLRDQRF